MLTGLLAVPAWGNGMQSLHNHCNSEKANLMMLAMHRRLSIETEKVLSY